MDDAASGRVVNVGKGAELLLVFMLQVKVSGFCIMWGEWVSGAWVYDERKAKMTGAVHLQLTQALEATA